MGFQVYMADISFHGKFNSETLSAIFRKYLCEGTRKRNMLGMQGGLQQNTAISSCKELHAKTQLQETKF